MTTWTLPPWHRAWTCALLTIGCLVLGLAQPAAASSSEIRIALPGGLEGDPGDGVLSPGEVRDATDLASAYVDPSGRLPLRLQMLGSVLIAPGGIFAPAVFPQAIPGLWRPVDGFDPGRLRFGNRSRPLTPAGRVPYVLDEGGWHHAP